MEAQSCPYSLSRKLSGADKWPSAFQVPPLLHSVDSLLSFTGRYDDMFIMSVIYRST